MVMSCCGCRNIFSSVVMLTPSRSLISPEPRVMRSTRQPIRNSMIIRSRLESACVPGLCKSSFSSLTSLVFCHFKPFKPFNSAASVPATDNAFEFNFSNY